MDLVSNYQEGWDDTGCGHKPQSVVPACTAALKEAEKKRGGNREPSRFETSYNQGNRFSKVPYVSIAPNIG